MDGQRYRRKISVIHVDVLCTADWCRRRDNDMHDGLFCGTASIVKWTEPFSTKCIYGDGDYDYDVVTVCYDLRGLVTPESSTVLVTVSADCSPVSQCLSVSDVVWDISWSFQTISSHRVVVSSIQIVFFFLGFSCMDHILHLIFVIDFSISDQSKLIYCAQYFSAISEETRRICYCY